MGRSKRLLLQLSVLMMVCLSLAWGLSAQETCPGSELETRLPLQSIGLVIPEGGANNVRDKASVSGSKIGALPAGATFTVLEGPVCADDATWLRVDDGKGLIGWTVEIIDGEYALELVSPPYDPPTYFESGAIEYEGLHLDVSPDLADMVEARFVTDEMQLSETLPPALILTLIKGKGNEAFPIGVIRVMSAQSFNNQYLTTIPRLSTVLAGNSEGSIPSQMTWFVNTGSLMVSALKQSIPFGNGTAQRSLSLYGDDALFPSNYLTYEAHGLTDDGLYYVQAQFLVTYNSTFVPPTEDRSDPNLAALIEEFHASIEAALNGASFESFSPNPTQLDTLLSTLVVDPGTLDEVVAEADMTATVFAATQQALPSAMQTATQSAIDLP